MTAERALRLIWLAEMAQLNPGTHEQDFLRLSKNKALRATVIAHYVKRQIHPNKAIAPYLMGIVAIAGNFGKTRSEIYSKTNNREF